MFNRVTGWINSIEDLGDNGIFCFGSNLSGRHGKGAAAFAKKLGAKNGQAIGLQGRTYAIPTVNAKITKSLSLATISVYVDEFIEFAKTHKELNFYVSEIACGLAGYRVEQIAPMFIEAMDIDNIALPQSFWDLLNDTYK